MASIGSKWTGPEKRLFGALVAMGCDVVPHPDGYAGSPDFRVGNVMVFVNGCFWHGCERHYREPGSNVKFWRRKISANRRRDARCSRRLRREKWRVATVWEHESPERAARRIARLAGR